VQLWRLRTISAPAWLSLDGKSHGVQPGISGSTDDLGEASSLSPVGRFSGTPFTDCIHLSAGRKPVVGSGPPRHLKRMTRPLRN
jgi:hypothetical protein